MDDEVEKRRKRLEELKQQSLDLEKETAEREKRNEERRKQREEAARIAAEQERKEEEERQKKRDERKRLREEEERKFNEEMSRLEAEKLQRKAGGGSATSTPSPSTSISSSTSTSSLSLDSDPDVKKQQEEREKRMEERKKNREEAQRQLELEEKRIAEEREKRKEDRRVQMEQESKSIQDVLIATKTNSSLNLKSYLSQSQQTESSGNSEKQSNQETEDNFENYKKEEKERLDQEEKEKQSQLQKEKEEQEEKDKQAQLQKEKEEQEEKDKQVQLQKEQEEQEEKAKQLQLQKEKEEQEEKERQAQLQKEKEEQEEKAKQLQKEQEEQDRLAQLQKEKEEQEEKERQAQLQLQKEQEEKDKQAQLQKEKEEQEEKERQAQLQKEKEEEEEKAKQLQLQKEKEEQDRLTQLQKEKEEQEEKARQLQLQKEKEEQEEKDKQAQLQKEKEEQDRLAQLQKEKEEQEEKAKQVQLQKEKEEQEEKEKQLQIQKEKEQEEKARQVQLQKEKEEQEEKAKQLQLQKEKEEQDRLAQLQKEKEEQEEKAKQLKLQKEKEEQEEKEKQAKLQKEKEEQEEKAKQLQIQKEKEEKEKQLRLQKEKEEKERLAKEKSDKDEKERLAKEKSDKEKVSMSSTTKVTDSFKQSIEKQLQSQLASKLDQNNSSPSTSTSSSPSSHSQLVNLTLDRPKMKSGRKLPSKNFKAPGSTETTISNNNNNDANNNALSQALSSSPSSEAIKKKIVLPPGTGGLIGSMASLAMEAQKKKLEKDNKLLSVVKSEEAPSFVRGRSQSVSVSSTLKDNTGKFIQHKKTVDTYSGQRTRLIHCKGKKRILTKEVEISMNSLNKQDVFVLDCGIDGSNVGGESADSQQHSTIYIFYGSKSTANKKSKAVGIAEIIKSHERGGHATIIKLDEGEQEERFYSILKGSNTTQINPDGGDDLEAETHWAQSFTLSRFEASNSTFVNIETKSLSMELLSSESHFILDTGTEFYEWSGRNADINVKDLFHAKSQERLKSSVHRQQWVGSVVLSEGGETVLFREKFFDWPDLSHEVSLNRMGFGKKKNFSVAIPYEKKSPAKLNQFEAREMISLERAEEVMKSDGKGEYEIWYLENMKMFPLPKEEYGHFYSGSCYILRYTYTKWNALKYIIFYWQGIDASRQDVGSSSLLVKDLYIETSNRGECTQEGERQGRESSHFLYIFNGKMIVHRGVRGEFDFTSKRLYHCFGRTSETINAVQSTKLSSIVLNSRDTFILSDSKTTFIWEGKGSSKSLKEQTNELISKFFKGPSNSLQLIKEGQEPEEFWKMLGVTSNQHKYANFEYLSTTSKVKEFQKDIKMFAVINTGTIIRADEIFRFSQYDLTPSKVFILDNQVNVFVWSGSRSLEKEKKRGMEIAIEYIKLLEDSRSEQDVLFITEKEEPLSFTCYFQAWDSLRFLGAGAQQQLDGADELPGDFTSPKVESAVNILKKYYQIVPYDQLTQKTTPKEIDRSVLEMYLSDEEFEKHLGMSKLDWESYPSWKKTEKKKSANLF